MSVLELQECKSLDSKSNFQGVGKTKQAHLLQFEDVLVEVILQLLICIVDTELLKAVVLKVLKAKNVQDPNGQTLEKQRAQLIMIDS